LECVWILRWHTCP